MIALPYTCEGHAAGCTMIRCVNKPKPKGLMLILAYAIAVPVWLLSAPLALVADLFD